VTQKTEELELVGNTSWEDPAEGGGAVSNGVYRWEDALTKEQDGPTVGSTVFRGDVDGGPDTQSGGDADAHTLWASGWLKINDRGKIYAEGNLGFPGGKVGNGHLDITGGTKDFKGASGSVTVTRSNPKRYKATIVTD
jgi:hypothetical protein